MERGKIQTDLQRVLKNPLQVAFNVGPHSLPFALPVTLEFFEESLELWIVSEVGEVEKRGVEKEKRKRKRESGGPT